MTTPRLLDWETRLSDLILERLNQPFKWGVHDCALWAADARLAVTGVDAAAGYRGTYRTAKGALRRLRRVDGVGTPAEAADKHWGPRLRPALVKVGDPVAADLVRLGIHETGGLLDLGLSLGVCYGRNSLFVGVEGGRPGLLSVPTHLMEHGYG
jgi:hypothetical protein